MTRNDRSSHRWALILLGATALTLGGCGRKGPLDLPPTASSQQQQQQQATANAVESDPNAPPPQASNPNLFAPNSSANAQPTAGRGPKRPFALDPLLNSN